MITFNPQSGQHLSCLLFGGELKEEVIEPVLDDSRNPVLFKTGQRQGQIKTHKVEKIRKIQGLLEGKGSYYSERLKTGFWKVDEGVLNKIKESASQKDVEKITSLILEIRGLEKMLGTYYNGVSELVYDIDSCVHPNFNQVSTDTGRLSCNNPNVQNLVNNEFLKVFGSRYET